MEERVALFREFDTGAFSVVELCRRHRISRETFYVWKERRDGGDPRWFEEPRDLELSARDDGQARQRLDVLLGELLDAPDFTRLGFA